MSDRPDLPGLKVSPASLDAAIARTAESRLIPTRKLLALKAEEISQSQAKAWPAGAPSPIPPTSEMNPTQRRWQRLIDEMEDLEHQHEALIAGDKGALRIDF